MRRFRAEAGGGGAWLRLTRYEGSPPPGMDEALQTKKEAPAHRAGAELNDMKGVVFLADRHKGTIVGHLPVMGGPEGDGRERRRGDRVREEVAGPGKKASVDALRGGAPRGRPGEAGRGQLIVNVHHTMSEENVPSWFARGAPSKSRGVQGRGESRMGCCA